MYSWKLQDCCINKIHGALQHIFSSKSKYSMISTKQKTNPIITDKMVMTHIVNVSTATKQYQIFILKN